MLYPFQTGTATLDHSIHVRRAPNTGFTSMKKYRNPSNVHPPVASYTHQIEIRGPERMLILSGQIGQKLDGSVPEDALEQLEVAWMNLRHNLSAAKMEVTDLVKITTYVVGKMDVTRRRAVFAAQLRGHKPCMTMVFVVALASPLYKVELDAWASRAGSRVSGRGDGNA
jgi:enamine deaminase RidA (YjgF/YER057c/UK114 family)